MHVGTTRPKKQPRPVGSVQSSEILSLSFQDYAWIGKINLWLCLDLIHNARPNATQREPLDCLKGGNPSRRDVAILVGACIWRLGCNLWDVSTYVCLKYKMINRIDLCEGDSDDYIGFCVLYFALYISLLSESVCKHMPMLQGSIPCWTRRDLREALFQSV